MSAREDMPYQSRGFWCCDYCKLTLDSFEDAKQHEVEECQQNPNKLPQQQPQQVAHAANQPQHHQLQPFPAAFYQPRPPPPFPGYFHRHPTMAPVTNPVATGAVVKQEGGSAFDASRKSFAIMGLNETSHMNADDSVACQSLEVFEAGPPEDFQSLLRVFSIRMK